MRLLSWGAARVWEIGRGEGCCCLGSSAGFGASLGGSEGASALGLRMDLGPDGRPMGFGGDTTLLGCKITSRNRLPASFYVSMSYACWAHRRRGITLDAQTNGIMGWLYETPQETVPSLGADSH